MVVCSMRLHLHGWGTFYVGWLGVGERGTWLLLPTALVRFGACFGSVLGSRSVRFVCGSVGCGVLGCLLGFKGLFVEYGSLAVVV